MQAAVCVFVRLLRALANAQAALAHRSARHVRHVRALTVALAHGLRTYAPYVGIDYLSPLYQRILSLLDLPARTCCHLLAVFSTNKRNIHFVR